MIKERQERETERETEYERERAHKKYEIKSDGPKSETQNRKIK